jgi:4a-hydroxytetrahydrobiopterin dehydratase
MGLRDPLPAVEVDRRLRELAGWQKSADGNEIHRTFAVEYYTAIQAIGDVAASAKELEHHPDIDLRWEKLHFSLTTYSAGQCLTELDFLLAARINYVLGRVSG